MRRRSCLTVLALTLAGGTASADEPQALLERARRALVQLDYERAMALVTDAWQAGASGPKDLAEIHRLAGQLAIILDDDEAAVEHFEQLCAIVPDSRFPDGTSPKITGALDKARERVMSVLEISVVPPALAAAPLRLDIGCDPVHAVAGVRVELTVGDETPRTIEYAGRASIEIPVAAGHHAVVASLVDRFGNELYRIERRFDVEPAPQPEPIVARRRRERPAPRIEPIAAQEPPPPLYARPWPWLTLAGLGGASAAMFAIETRQARIELELLNGNSSAHEFQAALDAESELRRNELLTNISLVTTATCAVTAAILLWRGRGADRPTAGRARVFPGTGGALAGVSIEVGF